MDVGDITQWPQERLTKVKERINAEIQARDQFPDETLSAVVKKAEELHGQELDPAVVRTVLSAHAALDPSP